ncbi:MAG: peptidylprolyl isomerase [Peptococcaceae bacterium]|nr:peptidylprolyl isomerase [Peptococcaceae bacterium]
MKKAFAMLLVAVMSASVLAGCGSSSADSQMGGEEVIKVNDTALHKNYVDARIDQVFKQNQLESDDAFSGYYKSQIITGLVETELMVQEAKERGIEVSDEDKENYKSELIEQSYGSQENFDSYLSEYNISDDMLDRMLEEKLYYDKLIDELKKDVKVDPETYYNEHKDEFNVGDQVKAAHILVEDEDTAKKIIKKLDDGEDFAKLAKEYSKDTATADQGGELGYFTADKMVTEFSDAAFALEKGKYTETPVKTSYGYHIILCEDKQAAHQQTYDEVKDELTETLTNQEVQSKYQELIEKRKKDSKIEYLSDDYNPDKLVAKAEEEMAKQQEDSSASSETGGAQQSASDDATASADSSSTEESGK